MKFPYLLHFVLTGVVAGAAIGANQQHLQPIIAYPLTGGAIALGISCVFRLFV